MSLNTVTLTWDFTDLVQSGETAVLVIAPTAQLTDIADGLIVAQTSRQVAFTGGLGQLAGIIANDNPAIAPAGTGYTITVTTAAGQVIYGPTVVIIAYANGVTQKLSSLSPAQVVTAMAGYLQGTYPADSTKFLRGDGQWTAVPDNDTAFLQAASNLSDLASAGTARANLGLGSAATQSSSAFDTAGAAAAVQALAALRANNLSDLANAGTARANLGLGTAATQNSTAFDAAGAAAAVQALAALKASNLSDLASVQAALNNLAGAVTAGLFLRGNGTNVLLAAIQASDVPTLNQNTTGTAAGLSSTLAIGSGGTGQASQQAAIDALTGTQSAGKVLRSDGAHATLAAIQAGDLPAASTSTQGAVQLDGTAADIASPGTQAAGSTGKAADAGHVHPAGGGTLADNLLLAWSAPVEVMGAGVAAVAGTLYLIKIPVRVAVTATNLLFVNATASSGASSGSFAGLYSSAGTLLSGSSDTGTWSSGVKQVALTSAQALTAGTFVWAAVLVNFATTQPSPRAFSGGSGVAANVGLSATAYRAATNGTGLASLPASITPSSNAQAAANPYWVGIT